MPPVRGQVRGRTSREWTGTKGSGAVVQKVPCEGTDAAGVGGKCGGISAANSAKASGGDDGGSEGGIPTDTNMY